ncbi:uncharacterized protein LOC125612349 [Marmota marmota marmota]|uniref:uncharacterized protein LOC125612349 n=1 Tax=Marmota marmota marmota TaxID=9994 RepID=UPI0020939E54|nr:uncharacterized protein LOC125612349 [Marmota marmota marmota]
MSPGPPQGSCDGTARPVTPEQPGHSWLLRNQGDTEEPLRTQTGAGRAGFAGDPWPTRLDSQLPVCLLGPVAGLVHAIGLPLGPGPSPGTAQDRGWARAALHPERPESRVLKWPAQRWRGASTATCHTSCDQSSDRSGRPGLGCSSVAEHLTGTQEKTDREDLTRTSCDLAELCLQQVPFLSLLIHLIPTPHHGGDRILIPIFQMRNLRQRGVRH